MSKLTHTALIQKQKGRGVDPRPSI